MSDVAATGRMPLRARTAAALRSRRNWVQLAKFSLVGASGFAVNLGVFAALNAAGVHYLLAAVLSFVVAVGNNYTWNRVWTFRGHRGGVAYQGSRFLVVSLVALGLNVALLRGLVAAGLPEVAAQAVAICLVMPVNFVGNRLWSFGRR